MIEILKYYSRCNQKINLQMISIIENATINAYDAPVDGFFKNIGEILDHIYTADVRWLNSFKTVKTFSIFKDPIFDSIPNFKERISLSIVDMKDKRTKLDAVIDNLVNEIEESDLNKLVVRVNRFGEKQEKIFWKSLVHVFNHETHHRAQISQILDQLKIENDYSNMIAID